MQDDYAASQAFAVDFEHRFARREGGAFAVLFLTTKLDYLTAMIRWAACMAPDNSLIHSTQAQVGCRRVFYDLADAFIDHPQARVSVWGPGFDGYADDCTLQENLRKRYPCNKIDIIYNFLGAHGSVSLDRRKACMRGLQAMVPEHTGRLELWTYLDVTLSRALHAGTFSDPANNDLRLYRQWEQYEPCPGQVLFEELPDCHDYPVRARTILWKTNAQVKRSQHAA